MPGALVLVCAALGAAVAAQAVHLRKVKREADLLRGRIERLEARQNEAAASARAAEEQIRDQVARVEKAATAPPPPAPPAPPAPAPEGAAPPAATAEDIRRIVDEKVDEKMKAREEKQAQGGDRKMPLHDLAKELALDPVQQPRVAEVANTTKKEIFDLLKTPRPDGTSLADELLDAFLSGETPRVQQTFLRIFSEKIPGSETTYLEGTARLQEKGYQGLERVMGPDVYARFRHMNVHPENIETGFDPWGEYLRQRPPK
jgi:hypothetical protein